MKSILPGCGVIAVVLGIDTGGMGSVDAWHRYSVEYADCGDDYDGED